MKLKTHKAVLKRVKLSGKKGRGKSKVMIRTGGQNHFNSRESGKVTKNKRRDKELSSAMTHQIRRSLPHHS